MKKLNNIAFCLLFIFGFSANSYAVEETLSIEPGLSVTASGGKYIIDYSSPNLHIDTVSYLQNTFVRISVDSSLDYEYADDVGRPSLPLRKVRLVAPFHTNIVSHAVSDVEYQTIKLNNPLFNHK